MDGASCVLDEVQYHDPVTYMHDLGVRETSGSLEDAYDFFQETAVRWT